MQIRKAMRFVFQMMTAGLALAFVIVLIRPDLLPRPERVVELHTAPGQTQRPANGAETRLSFRPAVRAASPAVVNVFSARAVAGRPHPDVGRLPNSDGSAQPRVQTGLGSGVIVSAEGFVLTNNHVIGDADEIHVMLADGRSAEARLVGGDPETDVAVLQIDLPDLPTITLADSDGLEVGDVVLAIGNPYGVGQTVTLGIVSATGRKRLGLNTFEDFIQTDAAINPGNSGGALINTRGHLVGLNTAIFSHSGGSQGIGFAIPANLVRSVSTDIIEHGHVIRGWLGIQMTNPKSDQLEAAGLSEPFGVVVTHVVADSPAARAGLQAGDLLTGIEGQQIFDARHLLDLVAERAPGADVVVNGIREGRRFSTSVTLAERPAP